MNSGNKSHSRKKDTVNWILSIFAGALLGFMLVQADMHLGPEVPIWLTFPFLLLLLSIAVTPLVNPHWWHQNYPNVSLFLGGFVASIYSAGYENGVHKLIHSGHEYLSFLALVGGLFIVASCIKFEISGKGRPLLNSAILAFGAVISNFLGTTGASMLLIRPFIKLNQGRVQSWHILFFIMIVSNCGGALTPIGDPHLYLGYLKGVPFFWTLEQFWESWIFVVGSLLVLFYLYDHFLVEKQYKADRKKTNIRISGNIGLVSLALMIAAIFIDPILARSFDFKSLPVTAIVQIAIAATCYIFTNREIKKFNEFSFEPFKEVALIFAGIFATMIPALDYLAAHGESFGIVTARSFYFGSGILSAFLDNAPTYLNFLQVAIGPNEINRESLAVLIADTNSNHILMAISTGAVFFGALTYIGNGPNFMVRSISENVGVKTFSFFGYLIRALCVLGPILIIHALLLF